MIRLLVVSLTIAAACSNKKSDVPKQSTDGLIPRSVLFSPPERTSVQISPDGSHLSFLAPTNGILNVWVAPVDKPSDAKVISADKKRPIRSYFWTYDSKQIIYSQDAGGDENWQLFAIGLEGGKAKNLVNNPKVAARVGGVSPKFPQQIVILKNDRNPQLHDPHVVNTVTGESKLLIENPGFAGFVIDEDYKVRMGAAPTPDGGMTYLVPTSSKEKPWAPAIQVGPEDVNTTQPVGFDENGNLLLRDSRGRNTAAFYVVDNDGNKKLIAENAKADGQGLLQHPKTKKVLAATFTYAKRETVILDESIQKDNTGLKALAGENEFAITSTDHEFSKAVVAVFSDVTPAQYYLWNRDTQKATYLFDGKPNLKKYELAPMQVAEIPARDGLKMVSYYTLPKKMSEAKPMVLLVHGGPWARDSWGFNGLHQLLANRGYTVLSTNFRGSTGFGKAHLNAGNKEWGKKMHTDLLDAVEWAVNKGIASKDKICIMGGSYGGYATLAGLTLTPDAFTCGVDIVGPSSIITLLKAVPPYWKPMLAMFKNRVGDWTTEDGKKALMDVSPLTHADKIRKPLLIGQGANDPRVKQAEADQIVEAMKKQNIPVTYALFPDEGHGFAKPDNNIAFWGVTEAFLAKHLGGRAFPLSEAELKKSTMKLSKH